MLVQMMLFAKSGICLNNQTYLFKVKLAKLVVKLEMAEKKQVSVNVIFVLALMLPYSQLSMNEILPPLFC